MPKLGIAAYLRGAKLFLAPVARETSGIRREIEPVQVFDHPVSQAELGRGIEAALEASDKVLSPPSGEDYKLPSVVQLAAGVKTERQFVRGTRACDLDRVDEGYSILPLSPGPGLNFEFDTAGTVKLPLNTPMADLAARLLAVLESCDPHP